MVDTRFCGYVSEMLHDAGHMITSVPVYTNHSASEALYIDSIKDVTTSRSERTLLMQLSNISLMAELSWPGVVEDLTETVHIYSITMDVSEKNRSQIVADTHRLLHQYWDCHHSIVFYKNRNQYIISFADKDQSHILSDWFDINVDYDEVVERLDTANISFESSISYYSDFIYAIARKYYLYPISVEEATYSMIPVTFVASAFGVKTEVSKDDVKALAKANLLYYETLYGDDYVAPVLVGYDEQAQFRRMATELDRISFELELAAELDDEDIEITIDDNDDLGEFDDEFGDDFDEDLDPAIFDDPVLMVKWLERHENRHEGESFVQSKSPNATNNKQKAALKEESEDNIGNRRKNEVVLERSDRQRPVVAGDQANLQTCYSHTDGGVHGDCCAANELIKLAHIKRSEANRKRQEACHLREEATRLTQDSVSALSHLSSKRVEFEGICKKREAAYRQKQQITDRIRNEAECLRSIAGNKRTEANLARSYSLDMRRKADAQLQASTSAANRLAELRIEMTVREQAYWEAERRERERLEAERREHERLEAERRERERLEAERREHERLEAERREHERLEAERRERERLEAERRERERLEEERRQQERLRQIHQQKLVAIQQKKNEDISVIDSALGTVDLRLKEIEQRLSVLTFLQFVEKRNLKAEQTELIERQTNLKKEYSAIENKYKVLFDQENRRYEDCISQIYLQ